MDINTTAGKVMVIVAHPDDEILGCGATMKKLTERGADVRTLILGEGKTSRDNQRNREKRESDIGELREEVIEANKIVGVTDVHVMDFPDNRFDTVALLDIVKSIEKHIDEFEPTAVFTHFSGDLNIDHTITNKAVLTATRPQPGQTVEMVAAFEVLSSTEWNYPNSFSPSLFIDVNDKQLNAKINAMKAYRSELKDYPHPRSLKSIKELAKNRGTSVGVEYGEALSMIRYII